MNLIMPLCLRVGSGRKDVSHMKQHDITFALTLVLHAICPPNTKSATSTTQNLKTATEMRTGSLTFTGTRDTKTAARINTSLYQVAFLALKIMAICFEGQLITDWTKIARAMRELGKRNEAATFLWDFLDFVVTHRTPLFILMQPFIFQKLAQPPISDFERKMHANIRDKIRGIGLPHPKSRGALLMELAHEMKELKEELEDTSEEIAETAKKQEPVQPTVQLTSEIHGRNQRPSLIEFLTGGELSLGSKHASKVLQDHLQAKESSSSTSYGSTPNQANVSISEGPEVCPNETTAVSSAPTDRSRHSSASDEHVTHMHKSESLSSQQRAQKLRFVSSVEFRHSSGETSTTPLSPGSPAEDSSGENPANKSRLQRATQRTTRAQARKTFRLKKSRKNKVEISHIKLESEDTFPYGVTQPITPPITTTIYQSPPPTEPTQAPPQIVDPHRLRISIRGKPTEGSYDEDSAISQTSSTSGYRESYPVMHLKETLDSSPKAFPPLASPDLHDLPSTSSTTTNNFFQCDNSSPDCSLNENGERTALLKDNKSLSQNSLLMVFEQQDETTLI